MPEITNLEECYRHFELRLNTNTENKQFLIDKFINIKPKPELICIGGEEIGEKNHENVEHIHIILSFTNTKKAKLIYDLFKNVKNYDGKQIGYYFADCRKDELFERMKYATKKETKVNPEQRIIYKDISRTMKKSLNKQEELINIQEEEIKDKIDLKKTDKSTNDCDERDYLTDTFLTLADLTRSKMPIAMKHRNYFLSNSGEKKFYNDRKIKCENESKRNEDYYEHYSPNRGIPNNLNKGYIYDFQNHIFLGRAGKGKTSGTKHYIRKRLQEDYYVKNTGKFMDNYVPLKDFYVVQDEISASTLAKCDGGLDTFKNAMGGMAMPYEEKHVKGCIAPPRPHIYTSNVSHIEELKDRNDKNEVNDFRNSQERRMWIWNGHDREWFDKFAGQIFNVKTLEWELCERKCIKHVKGRFMEETDPTKIAEWYWVNKAMTHLVKDKLDAIDKFVLKNFYFKSLPSNKDKLDDLIEYNLDNE